MVREKWCVKIVREKWCVKIGAWKKCVKNGAWKTCVKNGAWKKCVNIQIGRRAAAWKLREKRCVKKISHVCIRYFSHNFHASFHDGFHASFHDTFTQVFTTVFMREFSRTFFTHVFHARIFTTIFHVCHARFFMRWFSHTISMFSRVFFTRWCGTEVFMFSCVFFTRVPVVAWTSWSLVVVSESSQRLFHMLLDGLAIVLHVVALCILAWGKSDFFFHDFALRPSLTWQMLSKLF